MYNMMLIEFTDKISNDVRIIVNDVNDSTIVSNGYGMASIPNEYNHCQIKTFWIEKDVVMVWIDVDE